jgi:hypothetical protein
MILPGIELRSPGYIPGVLEGQCPKLTLHHHMDARNEVADFYRHELARALNEQSFGVLRSEVTGFSENQAEGTIALLEGQTINVVLSSAGYKVGLFPLNRW